MPKRCMETLREPHACLMHVAMEACVPETAGRVPQPGPLQSGLCLPKAWLFSQSPSPPGGKVVLKYPRSTHRTHRALGGQWGDGCPGSMAGSCLLEARAQVYPCKAPRQRSLPLTLGPREACGSLRQGRGGQAAAPSPWPRARSVSMLHATPSLSPWPTASTCFLHNYVKGTWARCSKSHRLAGEQGGPASPQAPCWTWAGLCLSEAQISICEVQGWPERSSARLACPPSSLSLG